MKYQDILPEILRGEYVRFSIKGDDDNIYGWSNPVKMGNNGKFYDELGAEVEVSKRDMLSNSWEKVDMTFVFIATDDNGDSYLYTENPEYNENRKAFEQDEYIYLGTELLQRNTKQKYKLIPIKE